MEGDEKAPSSALCPTPNPSAETCCLSVQTLERRFLLTALPKTQHPLPVAWVSWFSLIAADL